ncbi:hypothetical protein [Rubrolithibacter danxiaensis]|uniref:hypothetical protein n=1 Tax=Rubrolithibacter danxiaensis TaxID=3390805 RepID=UPI003BF8C647
MNNKQKNNYYYNSITSNYDSDLYDSLLYLSNDTLYNYGDHQNANVNTLKKFVKKKIKSFFEVFFIIKLLLISKRHKKKIILSNAYVNLQIKDCITLLPPWSVSLSQSNLSSFQLSVLIKRINTVLRKRELKDFFSSKFQKLIFDYQVELARLFKSHKVRCLIVPNDLSFYENISIKIARENRIPTFVYLHGLPARCNGIDDNRADYLIVWGNGIKDLYKKSGVPAEKILCLKHPIYSDFIESTLRSDFSNVLVLSKALPGTPSSSNELILSDRTTSLYYLELVKENLKKFGVKSAKLRLHPAESTLFYQKNLIDNFYSIELINKSQALSKASLVVGPSSTMILDSLIAGVNYILYDPIIKDEIIAGAELVSPFDGSSFIKLTKTFEDFQRHVTLPKTNIDFHLLKDYFEVNNDDFQKFLKLIA